MAHDLQLDLDVLLPDAHGHHDQCVSDLMDVLTATDGVHEAHVIPPTKTGPAQLCLSVEPGRVSLRRLVSKARSAGAEVSARYGHAVWQIRGITHASRADNASARLRHLPGVLDAAVATGGTTRIEYDRDLTDEAGLRMAALGAGLQLETAPAPIPGATDRRGPKFEHDDHARPDHAHGDHEPRDHEPGDHEPGDHAHADHAHAGHAHSGHAHSGHAHGGRGELALAVAALVVYLVARVVGWTSSSHAVPTGLYVVAALVTGAMVARDVLGTLRARRFDIEMLMLAAAVGAALLGDWSDAALLLVLFSLGHSLEGYAMARARREIEALAHLAPPTAHRRTAAGDIEEVPIEEVSVDDVLVVRPNERIAADGIVISGAGSVDESPVTGESVPVDKWPPATVPTDGVDFERLQRPHRVFSGSLNGAQVLGVRVVRPASDSTLARVVQLVSEAETQVSPTQRLTQRIVRYFVPGVLVLVAVLLIVPPLVGADFRSSFLRAMAVLVAASPCALAIATPSAVLAAIARAARDGVLVKGGGPLEELGRVCTLAFDKTGTLTEGRPRLVAVQPEEGVTERELLEIAVSVEEQTDHPIARAVTSGSLEFVPDLVVPTATDVEAVVGLGMIALVDEVEVAIGNPALFDGSELPDSIRLGKEELELSGCTTMVVRRGEKFLGLLGVMDTPRPEAADTVRELVALGIHRTVVLSGDNQTVADAIATQIGVDEARGGLMPEDKVLAIRELAGEHEHGVAMIGDGVNDAPALASANVGIAMGAAGSDLALDTADIALMGDSLDRLPFTVGLARRASRVIGQNLFFSLGMVVVLIPLTIAGLGIGPAVIAHEGSTLVVVANALSLLAYRAPRSIASPGTTNRPNWRGRGHTT